jgi:hypothetical protein
MWRARRGEARASRMAPFRVRRMARRGGKWQKGCFGELTHSFVPAKAGTQQRLAVIMQRFERFSLLPTAFA